jgi:hypothetical protein
MNKLYKDIPRMRKNLKVIEQYNNFRQLGAEEDINYLNQKINNLLEIKDTQNLIKEFTWCCKMINIYYDEIEPEFKKQILQEEIKRELEEF